MQLNGSSRCRNERTAGRGIRAGNWKKLLRGSQIIFELEQTVEKGKGCVWETEKAVKQGGGEREGAHRETGEDKKRSGWLGTHERGEFGDSWKPKEIMLQHSLYVHARQWEIPYSLFFPVFLEAHTHIPMYVHAWVFMIKLTLNGTETWTKGGWGAWAQIRRVPPLL